MKHVAVPTSLQEHVLPVTILARFYSTGASLQKEDSPADTKNHLGYMVFLCIKTVLHKSLSNTWNFEHKRVYLLVH